MSSQTINLFLGALKGVLRELPDGASGFRVEPGALGYVTVQLMGPHGPLVACTVAQRIAPKSDGKQLTIDDAINRRSPKAVAPAPRVEKRRGPESKTEPLAEPGDTAAAEPTSDSATVADDDHGEDWGEDGREYPDGRPYAELRLIRSDWQRYRRAIGDVQGGAHQGDWMPDGDHRTLTVSRPQYDAIRAATQEHPGLWERVEVALLAEDATAPAPAAPPPAKAPLYFSFQPHAAADALASKRGRSLVFVYADGGASVEARAGEESIFFREYWSGACGWDSRDMKPEKPTNAKKGGRS